MDPRPPKSSLAAHSILAIAALLCIGIGMMGSSHLPSSLFGGSQSSIDTVATLGIEHTSPLTLILSMSTGTSSGFLEVSHESNETILLSLPSTWMLREVRGALLADVKKDPSSFGYTRWHIPKSATLSLTVPSLPNGVFLQNPSKILVNVRIKKINLKTGTVETDVRLVKDNPLRLW